MDPNANLEEQLTSASEILRVQDECGEDGKYTQEQLEELAQEAGRLAELVQALDGWIRKGGFLPDPWRVGEVFDPVAQRWRREKGGKG